MLKKLVGRFLPGCRKRSTWRGSFRSHPMRSFRRDRSRFEQLEDRRLLAVYTSQDTPLPIPDPGVMTSVIAVQSADTVADVNVTLNIEHSYDADVDAFLIGPDGTRVELFRGVGAGGVNFDGTTFDDDAADLIDVGNAPFSGTFRPSGILADLNDLSSQGDWTLELADVFGGDAGTLLSWQLDITSSVATLSVGDVTVTEGDSTFGFIDEFVPPDGGGLAASRDLLIGPDGNVYIASRDSHDVKVFDATTAELLRTLEAPELSDPWALAFDSDGFLYVAGVISNNVVRFDPVSGVSSEFVAADEQGLLYPKGLTFGPDGNLYVSANDDVYDLPTDRILRFDGETGAFIDEFVNPVKGSGDLDNPNGLAFGPDGNLYLSSTRSDNVLRYDGATGQFVDEFIAPLTAGLDAPTRLLFHTDGYLYVTGQANREIMRFDPQTGDFVDVAASGSSGFDFNAYGTLFINLGTNTGLPESHIIRYGPASHAAFPVSLSSPSATPVTVDFETVSGTAIAGADFVATSGTLTFAPGETDKTIIVPIVDNDIAEPVETFSVTLSDATVATITDGVATGTIFDDELSVSISDATVTEGSDTAQFVDVVISADSSPIDNPKDITIGPNGNYFVTSGDTHSVLEYDGETFEYIGEFVDSASGGLLYPVSLVFARGNLLVSSANSNAVLEYDGQTGEFLGEFVVSGAMGIERPTDLLVHENQLYVGAWSGDVHRYDLITGEFIDKFVATGAGGLSAPTGMAFGPDGNFYVADFPLEDSNVLRFDGATGAFIDEFIPVGYGGLGRAAGIEFGPDGNLFVVDLPNNSLLRYDGNTGAFLDTFVSPNEGSLDKPTRLLFKQNELFITSRLSDEVMRYTVPSWATFDVTLSSPSNRTVTVDYAVASGTASAGDDFADIRGTLTFAPGETEKTIAINAVDDGLSERAETFSVVLSNPTGIVITDGKAVGTILDSGTIGLSIGDATVTEGDSTLRKIDFFVPEGSGGLARSRFPIFGPDVTDDDRQDLYVVSADTRQILLYDGITGVFLREFISTAEHSPARPFSLRFGPDGHVYIHMDNFAKDGLNGVLRFDGNSGEFIDEFVPAGSGGLLDPTATEFMSEGDLLVVSRGTNEVLRFDGVTGAYVDVFVSAGSGGLSSIRHMTYGPDSNSDGVGELYVTSQDSDEILRFDGMTGTFLNVFASNADHQRPSSLAYDGDRFLYQTLRADQTTCCENVLQQYDAKTGELLYSLEPINDSWALTVGPDGLGYTGGNAAGGIVSRYGPASLATFKVSLSSPATRTVTVNYETIGSTAAIGSDFEPASGTIVFSPGETERTIIVPTINNGTGEQIEIFSVALSNPTGAVITDGTAVGTIIDDDPAPNNILLEGSGQTYRQDFDAALGIGGGVIGTELPVGWSVVAGGQRLSSVTAAFPATDAQDAVYNAGADGDRTLAIGTLATDRDTAIELIGRISGDDAHAMRLSFDVEAWAGSQTADTPGEAAFTVSIGVDSGGGFEQLVTFDGQPVTTGTVLSPGLLDGNLPGNRVSFDSGVLEVDIPSGALFRVRLDAQNQGATAGYIYGVDNLMLRTLVPGDTDGDGDVDPTDIVNILIAGKFATGPSAASWSEGDFDGDDDVDPLDIVAILTATSGQFPRFYARESDEIMAPPVAAMEAVYNTYNTESKDTQRSVFIEPQVRRQQRPLALDDQIDRQQVDHLLSDLDALPELFESPF